MKGPMGVHTRTTVVVTAFVADVENIPIPAQPGRWVRPDRIEVRYERVDEGGSRGEMLYCSTTVSGMKVNGDDKVCSAAGAVTFSDGGPAWVNRFVVDNMPRATTPAMYAIDMAYDVADVPAEQDPYGYVRPVFAEMPEGMAYRVKSAALIVAGVADQVWRAEMGKAFTNREGNS
jgi:hypothetical protein